MAPWTEDTYPLPGYEEEQARKLAERLAPHLWDALSRTISQRIADRTGIDPRTRDGQEQLWGALEAFLAALGAYRRGRDAAGAAFGRAGSFVALIIVGTISAYAVGGWSAARAWLQRQLGI